MGCVDAETDQLPDLMLAEDRKECCGVLEVDSGYAVAGGLPIAGDANDRPGVVVIGNHEFAHDEHTGFVFEFALDKRDRASRRTGQRVR